MTDRLIMHHAVEALNENLAHMTDFHIAVKQVADAFGVSPRWLEFAHDAQVNNDANQQGN
jgi:hypothetical protein